MTQFIDAQLTPGLARWVTERTKDSDFVQLLDRHGPPPKIIWLTCGNTSNQRMREIFGKYLPQAVALLGTSDLVGITGIFLKTT